MNGTSVGSLGFSDSACWGWEEKEGGIREMVKKTVRFFTSYSDVVCCSLGGCWRAGDLLAKCVIFSERQHLCNDFLLRFLMSVM